MPIHKKPTKTRRKIIRAAREVAIEAGAKEKVKRRFIISRMAARRFVEREKIEAPLGKHIVNLANERYLDRSKALQELEQINDKRAVEPLIRIALRDPEPELRADTAFALGHLGDTRAVMPLISRLKDPDMHVRIAVGQALGKLGDKRAVEPLSSIVAKEKDAGVVESATIGLKRLGKSQKALKLLENRLKEEKSPIKKSYLKKFIKIVS